MNYTTLGLTTALIFHVQTIAIPPPPIPIDPPSITIDEFAKQKPFSRGSGRPTEPKSRVIAFARTIQPGARISREQLNRLRYLAVPQSANTMRKFLGLPHAAYGNQEYFILDDEGTWVALAYNQYNQYIGYDFSLGNW